MRSERICWTGQSLTLLVLIYLLVSSNEFGHKLGKVILYFIHKLLSSASIFVLLFVKHFNVFPSFLEDISLIRTLLYAEKLSESFERASNLGRVGIEEFGEGKVAGGRVENFGIQNGQTFVWLNKKKR